MSKKTRNRKKHRRRRKLGLLGRARMEEPGAPPGQLVSEPGAPAGAVRVLAYGPDGYDELENVENLDRIRDLMRRQAVVWVNLDGVDDTETLQKLGTMFDIHPLALEDAAHAHQRPKVERYKGFDFIVMRMLTIPAERLESEQVSIALGDGFVVTFQEKTGDVLDPVRERIRHGRGRIRKSGADYLAYAVMDAIVDHYFPVLEQFGDVLEGIEEEVILRPRPSVVQRIYEVKRELIAMRRTTWPLREAVSQLLREGSPRFQEETRTFVRDLYDHTIQVMDMVESLRDISSSMMDAYISAMGNRTNDVMKVLTIIATIFMPLSFIAGLYGMNFDPQASPWNMPELGWRFGYPLALGLMFAVALSLLVYFRRKGWLGGDRR